MGSDFKHTPPPWFIRGTEGDRFVIGPLGGDGREVSEVALVRIRRGAGEKKHTEAQRDEAESLANAWLIAAAPDQHEALLEVKDLFFSPTRGPSDTRRFERRYHRCYEQVLCAIRRGREGR